MRKDCHQLDNLELGEAINPSKANISDFSSSEVALRKNKND
jgi:hypothetical protein